MRIQITRRAGPLEGPLTRSGPASCRAYVGHRHTDHDGIPFCRSGPARATCCLRFGPESQERRTNGLTGCWAHGTPTIRSTHLYVVNTRSSTSSDEQCLLCFPIGKRAKPTGMQGMNQHGHHAFCFGLSSTFRGQNNLAFRVWLGCYILHANTARNLMAKSRVQRLEFRVLQGSDYRALEYCAQLQQLDSLCVIPITSLLSLLHRHGFTDVCSSASSPN